MTPGRAPVDRAKKTARRVFVVAWIVLGVAGALNHTIAEKPVGRRFDLGLPHLRYGHVMFNKNLRVVQTYQYARKDGVRHDVADLVPIAAPGYKRARLAVTLLFQPRYLRELCFRSLHTLDDEITFFIDEYDLDVARGRPTRTFTLRCDVHGLVDR